MGGRRIQRLEREAMRSSPEYARSKGAISDESTGERNGFGLPGLRRSRKSTQLCSPKWTHLRRCLGARQPSRSQFWQGRRGVKASLRRFATSTAPRSLAAASIPWAHETTLRHGARTVELDHRIPRQSAATRGSGIAHPARSQDLRTERRSRRMRTSRLWNSGSYPIITCGSGGRPPRRGEPPTASPDGGGGVRNLTCSNHFENAQLSAHITLKQRILP